MTCKQEIDFLDRYFSGDLNECELERFESHLDVCRDCVAFVRTYKTTLDLTRSFLSSPAHAPAHPLKRRTRAVKRH